MATGNSSWDLVRDFMNGNEEAATKFFVLYAPAIKSYVNRNNLGWMAQDMEQQILMRIVRELKRPGFDETKTRFRGLLFICIKRAVVDEFRRNDRRPKEVPLLPDQDIEDMLHEDEWDQEYWDNIKTNALAEVQKRVSVETWQAFTAWQEIKSEVEVAKRFNRDAAWVYDLNRRILRMFKEECLKIDPDIRFN